jgi:glycosyltransferase involved in cell wall biosynthesis
MHTVVLYAADLERKHPTGLGRYSRNLARRLSARSAEGTAIRYRAAASPIRTSMRAAPDDLAVARPRLPRKVLHPAWGALGRPKADRALGHPDLIHVLYPATPVPSRAPVIYTIHDLFPVSHPEWFTPKARWLFKRAISDATERSVVLVANSEFTRSELVSRLGVDPARIRVVPMAVDDDFFDPADGSAMSRSCAAHGVAPGEYLIAIGGVSDRKNLQPVVKAVAHVSKSGNPMRLLVVGPPERGHEEIEQLVRDLGVSDVVRFTGWLPGEDLATLLAGASALVHPAKSEGFGMTPLEAMAAGVPTLVSRGGSLPEVTGGAALMADPDDDESWVEAIIRLGGDASLRDDLIRRGRARAEYFRWDRIASQTITLHRAVLDGLVSSGRPPIRSTNNRDLTPVRWRAP